MEKSTGSQIHKTFSIVFILVAFHSFITGCLLIAMPNSWFGVFGFQITNRFFPTQGGVFHFVMVLVYLMIAIKPEESGRLIVVVLFAKLIAAVYLLLYYFMAEPILTVLLSGLADFLMFMIIFYFYLKMGVKPSQKRAS